MKLSELRKAKKKTLLGMLLTITRKNRQLAASVNRMTKLSNRPPVVRHVTHDDDFVPPGWVEQHGIHVPRAEGIFESATAWVRITHGVITNAGLKNQSILSMMISMGLLDQGAEHHGFMYLDWKAAFLSRLDPSRSGGRGSDNAEAWTKEDRYSKLLSRVERDCLTAVEAMIAPVPKARHVSAFQQNQERFAEAFEEVAREMSAINREAEEAEEERRKSLAH